MMSTNIDIYLKKDDAMPAWNEYKQHAQERGSLALELYVVESIPAKPPEDLMANLPAHLAYQQSLEQSGNLALAGPLSDASGEQMQGTGLIIYRAESMEAAKALADADPMHSTGTRTYTLRKWLINEGSLNISVGLSTNHVSMT